MQKYIDQLLYCYHARRYNTNAIYAVNEKEEIDVYINVFGEDGKFVYSKAIKEKSAF